MRYRGFLSPLAVFGILILISAPFFYKITNASQSSLVVTQTVIDNSSGGGGGGGGGAGGGSGSGSGSGSGVGVVGDVGGDTGSGTGVGTGVESGSGDTGGTGSDTGGTGGSGTSGGESGGTGSGAGTGSSGGAGGEAGSSGGSGGGGGGGGVLVSFNQAVNLVAENITRAAQVVGGQVLQVSRVIARNTEVIVKSPVGRVAAKVAEPVGVVSGGVAIGSQILISTTTVTSFSDIYLLIIRTFGLIFGFFRKKRKPWGTAYDSVTKRPLDPAYVVIAKEGGEEVSDAITDLDGRFGFFVPAGRYTMTASKTNYSFPSKSLAGKERDEMYESLYNGELVENKEGEVVVRNVPLDPVNFDWNEFEKNKQNLFRLYSEKEKKWKMAFNYIYNLGFLGAILTAIFDGNYFNYTFLVFYLGIIIYQKFFIYKRTAVSLKYATGEPIPYSIIKLFSPALSAGGVETGSQVKSVVTDQLGRFYLLVGPGKYYLTVDAKQPDGSYKMIYKSEVMDFKNGIVPADILVPGAPEDYSAPPPSTALVLEPEGGNLPATI